MASEKIRVLRIESQKITSKKSGREISLRVLHCFVESSGQNPKTGEVEDRSFVAKATLFDDDVAVVPNEEYMVDYRLAEGFGPDAGKLVPKIVSWTPLSKGRPVVKPAGASGAAS